MRPESGTFQVDADTHMSPDQWMAYRAAGGTLRAVDMVLRGEAKNAFVAARPPTSCRNGNCNGFVFGNVALGAKHALIIMA